MSTEIEPPDITTATGQALIDAFEAVGANKPCHRCGYNDFTVLRDQLAFTMLTPMPTLNGQGTMNLERSVPVSVVVCRVCRCVTFHGYGAAWGSTVKPADAKTAP